MKSYVLLFGLCIATCCLTSCNKAHHEEKDGGSHPAAVKVKTMQVHSSDISGSQVYSGTVEESKGTTISFPIGGTMTKIFVDEGQFVSKGQLIAQLDAANLRHALDIAKSGVAQAQDAYNRMKMLHDSNSLPDMQWVEVENALRQAQSAEAIAQQALKDAQLYAPVSGYVLQKFMQSGMTVAPAEPVIKIVTLDPVKVNIAIPENEIATINQGQRANISVGAMADRHYSGTVTDKGIAANPISRAYDVKISVANPGNKLLPGMICDVTLEGSAPEQAIVFPTQAVLLDADNQNFVWVCFDGEAQKRLVDVKGMTDNGIIIGGAIADGDSVIVEGQQKVSEGTRVVVN